MSFSFPTQCHEFQFSRNFCGKHMPTCWSQVKVVEVRHTAVHWTHSVAPTAALLSQSLG
jgi:hypothetical protein